MSAEEKNKLDELFKSGLDVPDTHFEYNDQDWDDFEHLMGGRKRPRIIAFWLPVLSGVAALLLLVLGWWFFKPAQVENQQVAVVKHTQTQAPINNTNRSTTEDNDANGKVAKAPGAPQSAPGHKPIIANQQAPVYAAVVHSPKHNFVVKSPVANSTVANTGVNSQPIPVQENKKEILADNNVSKNNPVVNNPAQVTGNQAAAVNTNTTSQQVIAQVPAGQANTAPRTKKIKAAITGHTGPKFGLAMLMSPDINGAGSFQNAKVGANIGLQFSVSIKKLTISTGASYSKKPYTTDFSNYHVGYQFKTNPESVYADCRVLDIPINLDYQVYNKNHNSFSIGSGLSSYIMLKEKYTYDYADPATVGPANFTVNNKNRHILGVLNLNATYAHQLNNKFSIAAQPYLKIPLTNIGNSQVRLQSAGVAVGLRWNINQ
jgi:hypothetical protein